MDCISEFNQKLGNQEQSSFLYGSSDPFYIGNGQMTLPHLYTEYSDHNSTSGKEKSSSEDEPATDFTNFFSEKEDLWLIDLNFRTDLDDRLAASNTGLKPTSTEQSLRAGFSRQLFHNADTAISEFIQGDPGQIMSLETKRNPRICPSLQTTASNSLCQMSRKKAALRRIWMSCEPRSFPNSRKIRALAQLAEISSKTAREWLKEFVRLGLIPLPGQEVEQQRRAACVTRHGRPNPPFQPRNIARKYICTDCHHTFKRKDDWIKHTSLNYLQSYWQCLDCEYQCPAKRSDKLKQHFESKHPMKKLAVDAAIHYYQIDGRFEKQCGFCGHICTSFDDFARHVSRHFEDSTADPPYDMRIWRDPWPSEEAEHPDESEDDDEGQDDSDPENGQDGYGDNQDFDGHDEETDDDQDFRPPKGSEPDNFGNYPAAGDFDDGSASFDGWAIWRSLQEHKKRRYLPSEWTQHYGQTMGNENKLFADSRDKLWPMTSQIRQDESVCGVPTPFGILGLNLGLRQIRLHCGRNIVSYDIQGNDVKVQRGSWTLGEDERLLNLLDIFGFKNWIRIAEYMPKRSPKQCRQRYHEDLKLEALRQTIVRLLNSWCGGGGLTTGGICQKADLDQIFKSSILERRVLLGMYLAASRHFSSTERGPAKRRLDVQRIMVFNDEKGTTDTATLNDCGVPDTRMDLHHSLNDWADNILKMGTLWLTRRTGIGESDIPHTIAQIQKDRDRPARSLLLLDRKDKTDKGRCVEVQMETVYPGHHSLTMQNTTEDVTSSSKGTFADVKDEDDTKLTAEKAAKPQKTYVSPAYLIRGLSVPNMLSHHLSYGSGPSSGSNIELGPRRAVSFLTPSKWRSFDNGDVPYFYGDPSPCEHQNSSDPLQGISGSDYDARFDAFGKMSDTEISKPSIALREPWSQLNFHYSGQDYPSDMVEECIFQPTLMYDCSLTQWTQVMAHRHGQQQNVGGTGYQSYMNTPEHWPSSNTGQDRTYQETSYTTGSSSFSSGSSSAGSLSSFATADTWKTGGRKGPLTDSGRQNTNLMREKRSCYRCFIMREKCHLDEQTTIDGICWKCRKIFQGARRWVIPCAESGLDKRTEFILPRFLRHQFKVCEVDKFLKTRVAWFVLDSSVDLPLTVGFGVPLILQDYVEIVWKDQEPVRMLGVSAAHHRSTKLVELNNPPILPRLTDRKAIEKKINQWADSAIRETGSDLPNQCFTEPHEHWQREMLTIICKYHQAVTEKLEAGDSGPYHTLRRALKLIVLSHTMCVPFMVPEERIENLHLQLRGRYTFGFTQWTCPRLANKVLKSILLPMLYEMAGRVLSELQELLRTREQDEDLWDPLFCITFLFLNVVGKFQAIALARAAIVFAHNDFSFSKYDAASVLREMEEELPMHLIRQFHARFPTNRKGSGNGNLFNPLARDLTTNSSRFAEKVNFATRTYGYQVLNQNEVHYQDLGAMNQNIVARILADFMMPFI